MFAEGAERWSDPRARVLDGLGANTAVQFVGGRLQLEKFGEAEGPPLELRSLVDGMLPQLDLPELLLEVFDRTGLPADFTHISGADSPMEDFGVILAALVEPGADRLGAAERREGRDDRCQTVTPGAFGDGERFLAVQVAEPYT